MQLSYTVLLKDTGLLLLMLSQVRPKCALAETKAFVETTATVFTVYDGPEAGPVSPYQQIDLS